jgi:HSP20 family protein
MELTRYEPRSVWEPFPEVWDLRNEMNRMFESFFGHPTERGIERGWRPAVDIDEEKDSYIVRAELPGLKQDDIKISVSSNTLTLKGERKTEHKEKREGYHCHERAYGEFYRTFQLPTEVDAEKIKAKHKDGILEIEIPKSERVKPKEIPIKVE